MGDVERRPAATVQAFDPGTTPVPRRRVLLLMGAGALAAGGGLGVLLEACGAGSSGSGSATSSPPITVKLDLDPATLVAGSPAEVPFTLVEGGTSVKASAWLVKGSNGEIVAFDPRCTHASCRYAWSSDTQRFLCRCHPGQFALDGTVLGGPPPRPLDRFPARLSGTVLELDVPASFATPRDGG